MQDSYMPLLGFLINVIVLIISGVWVVGKINTTTQILAVNIENLTKAIELMGVCFKGLNETVNNHGERIVRVETKLGVIHEK